MRLTAYCKIVDSAKKLPTKLEGSEYFKTTYFCHDPRGAAISAILKKARKDTKGLFHSEFVTLFKYSRVDFKKVSDDE